MLLSSALHVFVVRNAYNCEMNVCEKESVMLLVCVCLFEDLRLCSMLVCCLIFCISFCLSGYLSLVRDGNLSALVGIPAFFMVSGVSSRDFVKVWEEVYRCTCTLQPWVADTLHSSCDLVCPELARRRTVWKWHSVMRICVFHGGLQMRLWQASHVWENLCCGKFVMRSWVCEYVWNMSQRK